MFVVVLFFLHHPPGECMRKRRLAVLLAQPVPRPVQRRSIAGFEEVPLVPRHETHVATPSGQGYRGHADLGENLARRDIQQGRGPGVHVKHHAHEVLDAEFLESTGRRA